MTTNNLLICWADWYLQFFFFFFYCWPRIDQGHCGANILGNLLKMSLYIYALLVCYINTYEEVLGTKRHLYAKARKWWLGTPLSVEEGILMNADQEQYLLWNLALKRSKLHMEILRLDSFQRGLANLTLNETK